MQRKFNYAFATVIYWLRMLRRSDEILSKCKVNRIIELNVRIVIQNKRKKLKTTHARTYKNVEQYIYMAVILYRHLA
jgi:hypothetical protein